MGASRRSLTLSARPLWRSLVAALVLVLTGTGWAPSLSASLASSPRAPSHVKMGGTVVIDNVSGSLWTCGFNPYSPSVQGLTVGVFYEPLWYINQLNDIGHPWLATSYAWSHGNRMLTFTIRPGVRWSDGKPFTPADVVFTFRLLKRFTGLDLNAIWTVLSGVYQSGNKVVFTFKQAAVPFFYYIAGQTYMLPEHVWSKVKNPVTYINKRPMGTGPFLLRSCSPQNITYVRNPHYWQPGKPYISEVRYPAFMDNQPGNLYLRNGNANWGGQYIPNVQAYYLSVDRAHRHIWYPPGGAAVGLYPNLAVYPLNNLAVREAISLGINRPQVSRLGVYGYLPPANQAGIIVPNFKSWLDTSLLRQYNFNYNPAKAASLLQSAGFKRGSDGIFRDKSGKKLSLSIINVGGFTDWVAEVGMIVQSLHSIGIEVKPENLSGDDYTSREETGHFQLAYGGPAGGPAPYYQYLQLLLSANSAPIGKTASSNFERFHSAYIDSLLRSYAKTNAPAQQHRIINLIQATMLRQVPFIPVLEGVHWYQYDTRQLTGWPTPQNPYASPAPYDLPDWEVVLTHLHLK